MSVGTALHARAPEVAARAATVFANARLPRWLLPETWPRAKGEPLAADLHVADGRIEEVRPCAGDAARAPGTTHHDLRGAPTLPLLVDAHVHLDKAFTFRRVRAEGEVAPGLVGAIEASLRDFARWTEADVRERALRGLAWSHAAGVRHLRTHVNWSDPHTVPLAWQVLGRLAQSAADSVRLERVSLTKLETFGDADDARRIARAVATSGTGAVLGAFVHSGNLDDARLANLLQAAADADLDLDLHLDEELTPHARGLETVARELLATRFEGRVVCGHVCALAAMPEADALRALDLAARAPISLVALPITNLLLQDAQVQRTPRQRGLTLVKEARARGIPVLFASDNVQDPFCPVGSFDPVDAMASATLAAQLDNAFDDWSDALCRADGLSRELSHPVSARTAPTLVGAAADFLVFPDADASAWPSRSARRQRVVAGEFTDL